MARATQQLALQHKGLLEGELNFFICYKYGKCDCVAKVCTETYDAKRYVSMKDTQVAMYQALQGERRTSSQAVQLMETIPRNDIRCALYVGGLTTVHAITN